MIAEFNRILDLLEADLSLIYAPLKSETDAARLQMLRRNYFRSAFVYIEAVVFQFKRLTLEQAGQPSPFSAAELSLLHEQAYRLAPNGAAQVRPAFLPLLDNMKFTASMFAKAHRSELRGAYEDSGWQALHQAQHVRNRLTHPKHPTDLDVTSEEMALLQRALARFRAWQEDLFKSPQV